MKNICLIHRFVRRAIAALSMTVAATTAVSAQQAAMYEIVSTFDQTSGRPVHVIQTRTGQFYATTLIGVFAMAADGSRTMIYRFPPNSIGGFLGAPGGLSEGTDGNLYGTASTYNAFVGSPGHIFKINPDDGVVTTLASGIYRLNGVTQARDGRLHGTAFAEIDQLFVTPGRVFRVEAGGTFTSLPGPGNPVSELVEIDDGSLYGTGASYGTQMSPVTPGEIFQLIPNPATGGFTRQTRHTFAGPDGWDPYGRLIQGADGLIYGTTLGGGLYGSGTVFSLDAAGTLTTLHHFSGPDGSQPLAGVIQGFDGRLYGTTSSGGAFNLGTVFVMNVTGGLTTLHDFAPGDGGSPYLSELIQASDGALYGVAAPTGANSGVIFRVRLETTPPADGYVEIVSRNSGKCLDVFAASTDAAASVIQWVCHGGPNQQWRLEQAGGGAFYLIARHSGQALDVYGALLDDVTPIIQWPLHGGDNQAWTLQPASDGYVSIVARHSGKVLDVEFASTDDGARVIQYTPHGGANQQWLLRAVPSTADAVSTRDR